MTDADALRAERLARLSQRRTDRPLADVALSLDATPPAPATPANRARGRRRSPATTAKILTVGASTTAVLGMMAGYGIAEHAAAGKPILLTGGEAIASPASADSATSTVPQAAPTATIPPTVPPQVIVVVIDGTTGQRISGDFDLSTLAAAPPDTAIAAAQTVPGLNSSPSSASAAPVATPAAASAPAPVAVPVAVDLAVPAAPPPPAPASAPEPQATSSGS